LSSTWRSLALELAEMAQHEQEDELGFGFKFDEIRGRGQLFKGLELFYT
jgi:hypothetical protein